MALPEIADHDTWLTARRELLGHEKRLTKELDQLSAARRRLPMVRVEKHYEFAGAGETVSLRDLFDDHHQLIVQHFMYDPSWDTACNSCSRMADSAATPGILRQLDSHGTAFAAISRAPYPKLAATMQERGWTFPWYSSFDNDFNYDFHVSFDPDKTPTQWNFVDADEMAGTDLDWLTTYVGEQPGISCFLREGDQIYLTYSTYGRGVEAMMPTYRLLDLTGLGRQEPWEEPKGRALVQFDSGESVLSDELV